MRFLSYLAKVLSSYILERSYVRVFVCAVCAASVLYMCVRMCIYVVYVCVCVLNMRVYVRMFSVCDCIYVYACVRVRVCMCVLCVRMFSDMIVLCACAYIDLAL